MNIFSAAFPDDSALLQSQNMFNPKRYMPSSGYKFDTTKDWVKVHKFETLAKLSDKKLDNFVQATFGTHIPVSDVRLNRARFDTVSIVLKEQNVPGPRYVATFDSLREAIAHAPIMRNVEYKFVRHNKTDPNVRGTYEVKLNSDYIPTTGHVSIEELKKQRQKGKKLGLKRKYYFTRVKEEERTTPHLAEVSFQSTPLELRANPDYDPENFYENQINLLHWREGMVDENPAVHQAVPPAYTERAGEPQAEQTFVELRSAAFEDSLAQGYEHYMQNQDAYDLIDAHALNAINNVASEINTPERADHVAALRAARDLQSADESGEAFVPAENAATSAPAAEHVAAPSQTVSRVQQEDNPPVHDASEDNLQSIFERDAPPAWQPPANPPPLRQSTTAGEAPARERPSRRSEQSQQRRQPLDAADLMARLDAVAENPRADTPELETQPNSVYFENRPPLNAEELGILLESVASNPRTETPEPVTPPLPSHFFDQYRPLNAAELIMRLESIASNPRTETPEPVTPSASISEDGRRPLDANAFDLVQKQANKQPEAQPYDISALLHKINSMAKAPKAAEPVPATRGSLIDFAADSPPAVAVQETPIAPATTLLDDNAALPKIPNFSHPIPIVRNRLAAANIGSNSSVAAQAPKPVYDIDAMLQKISAMKTKQDTKPTSDAESQDEFFTPLQSPVRNAVAPHTNRQSSEDLLIWDNEIPAAPDAAAGHADIRQTAAQKAASDAFWDQFIVADDAF